MKLLVFTCLFFSILNSGGVRAQEKGSELETALSQLNELIADLKKPREDFDRLYTEKLNELHESATAAGNLELVLAVKDELNGFQKRAGLPAKESKFPELNRLTKIYQERIVAIRQQETTSSLTMLQAFLAKLETMTAEATRSGKIDEALAIRAEMNKVTAEIERMKSLGGLPSIDTADADLIGHWKFDGDGKDSSGYGRDAKLHGAEFDKESRVGSGALKTGPDKFAEVADHADFDLDNPFTIALWIKRVPGPQSEWPPIINKGETSWRLQLSARGDHPTFHLGAPPGHRSVDAQPQHAPTGTWQHMAVTYDGTKLIFYAGGVEVARKEYGAEQNPPKLKDGVRLGGITPYTHRYFNGSIDDARIYKRALEPEKIKALADVPAPK